MLSSLNLETENEARAAVAMIQITSLLGGGGDWSRIESILKLAELPISGGNMKTDYNPFNSDAFQALFRFLSLPFGWAITFGNNVYSTGSDIVNAVNLRTEWDHFKNQFGALFDAFRITIVGENGKTPDREGVFKFVAGTGIVGMTSYGVFKFYAWLKSAQVTKSPLLKEQREEFYKVFNDQLKSAKSKNAKPLSKTERLLVTSVRKAARNVEKRSKSPGGVMGGGTIENADVFGLGDRLEKMADTTEYIRLDGGKIRMRTQSGLKAWFQACEEKNGGRIPHKDTAAYVSVKRRMNEILRR